MFQTSSNKPLIHRHPTDSEHNVAFTTVDDGNMSMTVLAESQTAHDTEHNRRTVEQSLGITPGTTRFVSQTHSNTVLPSGPLGWARQDTLGEADAIISEDGKDPIAILVADCMPIAFTTDYGPSAIAHAGRVGLLDGVLENTVQRLRALNPSGDGVVMATIGPSICGECYEVPKEMRDEVAQHHPSIAAQTTWGTPALDLPAAAESILQTLDVTVHRTNVCTYSNELYYSHRRQPGVGRIAGFVWKDQNTQ